MTNATERTCYICDECGGEYDTKEEAEECCSNEEEEEAEE